MTTAIDEELAKQMEEWNRTHPPAPKPEKIKATAREKILLTLLRKLVKHIRWRDGMGKESDLFCAGCARNRRHPCVLPEALEMIRKESKRQEEAEN